MKKSIITGYGLLGILLVIVMILNIAIGVNGEIKEDSFNVSASDTYSFTIQAGSGDITIDWEVTDWNNDNLHFYIEDASGGIIAETNDVRTYTDTLYVERGYYRFVWTNSNWFESISVHYSVLYESYSEEVDKACCGILTMASTFGIIGLIGLIGWLRRSREK